MNQSKLTEAKIQASWIALLKKEGYLVTRLRAVSEAGWPDIIFLQNGRARFIEFKRPGGAISNLQRRKINELRKAGFEVYVVFYMPSKGLSVKELLSYTE